MLLLQLDTLCAYTNATPSSRNMIEGQKIVNSGLIFMCGASSRSPEKIELYALCLQSSAVCSSDPHVIKGSLNIQSTANTIDVDESMDGTLVKISQMTCSCRAGTSESCKHVVAVLLYCNRKDLNSLELLSPTDMQCLWSKRKRPVLEQFEAQPIHKFCCVNKKKLPALSESLQESIRTRLIDCDRNSALAKHRYRSVNRISVMNLDTDHVKPPARNPFQDITNTSPQIALKCNTLGEARIVPVDYSTSVIDNAMSSKELQFLEDHKTMPLLECCDKTYQKKVICNDVFQTAVVTKDCKAKWKEERQFKITGSRCYNLFTYSKGNWPDKAVQYFWAKEFTNKYVRHGTTYESTARDLYSKGTNLYVQECGLVVSKTEPWLAYSPDGVVIKDSKPHKLLEIKCPFELDSLSNDILLKKCKFLKLEGCEIIVKKKHQYYAQVQFGMALLNLKTCDLVVYSSVSNSVKIICVNYDQEYLEIMLKKLKSIHFENMLHEICKNIRDK